MGDPFTKASAYGKKRAREIDSDDLLTAKKKAKPNPKA
jgi:hypothetical protein